MMDFYFKLSYSPDFLSLYLFPYCYRGRKPTGLSHPFFGNGAGAHEIGKISGVLNKIGKFDIVLMYDVSIAR